VDEPYLGTGALKKLIRVYILTHAFAWVQRLQIVNSLAQVIPIHADLKKESFSAKKIHMSFKHCQGIQAL
jgi:hypothetical protein